MKVSEINCSDIAEYLKLEYSDLTLNQKSALDTLLEIAKKFITGQTGLTNLDDHDDFVIVVYILVQDMHDNRTLYVEKDKLNYVVNQILGMYSTNLV